MQAETINGTREASRIFKDSSKGSKKIFYQGSGELAQTGEVKRQSKACRLQLRTINGHAYSHVLDSKHSSALDYLYGQGQIIYLP